MAFVVCCSSGYYLGNSTFSWYHKRDAQQYASEQEAKSRAATCEKVHGSGGRCWPEPYSLTEAVANDFLVIDNDAGRFLRGDVDVYDPWPNETSPEDLRGATFKVHELHVAAEPPLSIYVNMERARTRPQVRAFVEFYLQNAPRTVERAQIRPLDERAYTEQLNKFNAQ